MNYFTIANRFTFVLWKLLPLAVGIGGAAAEKKISSYNVFLFFNVIEFQDNYSTGSINTNVSLEFFSLKCYMVSWKE